MATSHPPAWLEWARELQALGQTGVTYTKDEFDIQRYHRLLEIAAEIVAAHTTHPRQPVLANFHLQTGYATPKIDVRGVVMQHGQILLVQERSDQCWCLPGGWADVGIAPSEMVVKEVREESGLEVKPRQVVGIYDGNRNQEPLEYYHVYKILFLCEVTGGKPQPGDETLAVDFFHLDALPPLSRNRTNKRHLQDIWDFVQSEHPLTHFD